MIDLYDRGGESFMYTKLQINHPCDQYIQWGWYNKCDKINVIANNQEKEIIKLKFLIDCKAS